MGLLKHLNLGWYSSIFSVPLPAVTISTDPVNEGFHAGLELTFTGMVEFRAYVDTPLNVTGTWSKTSPPADLLNDTRVTLDEPVLVRGGPGSDRIFVSMLTIDGLDVMSEDNGDYTLSLDISSQAFTMGTSVNRTYSITVLRKDKQKSTLSKWLEN